MNYEEIPTVLIDLPGFFSPLSELLDAREELRKPPADATRLERQAYAEKFNELDNMIAERVVEPIESVDELNALLTALQPSDPRARELYNYYQGMLKAAK